MSWHVAMPEFCVYLDTRGFLPRVFVLPVFIKTEYLRECSASRVWPYMHQLRIMSLVKCWVCPAPVFCCLTFRIIGYRGTRRTTAIVPRFGQASTSVEKAEN